MIYIWFLWDKIIFCCYFFQIYEYNLDYCLSISIYLYDRGIDWWLRFLCIVFVSGLDMYVLLEL